MPPHGIVVVTLLVVEVVAFRQHPLVQDADDAYAVRLLPVEHDLAFEIPFGAGAQAEPSHGAA